MQMIKNGVGPDFAVRAIAFGQETAIIFGALTLATSSTKSSVAGAIVCAAPTIFPAATSGVPA